MALYIHFQLISAETPTVDDLQLKRVYCLQLDEFQDVAHAQYRLLHALTGTSTPSGQRQLATTVGTANGLGQRVTIVGDGDQAIYDWRGADVRLFEVRSSSTAHDWHVVGATV